MYYFVLFTNKCIFDDNFKYFSTFTTYEFIKLTFIFTFISEFKDEYEKVSKLKKRCVLDIETLSLEPTKGRIICIGMLNAETGETRVFYNEDEETMVRNFLSYYRKEGFGEIIGYNVLFDVRYIFARCLKYGLPAREFVMSGFTDVMMILKSVRSIYNFNKPGSLDEWAGYILNESKDLNNASVPLYYHAGEIDKIIEYNKKDVEMTYEIWKKIRHVFDNGIEINGVLGGDDREISD